MKEVGRGELAERDGVLDNKMHCNWYVFSFNYRNGTVVYPKCVVSKAVKGMVAGESYW